MLKLKPVDFPQQFRVHEKLIKLKANIDDIVFIWQSLQLISRIIVVKSGRRP